MSSFGYVPSFKERRSFGTLVPLLYEYNKTFGQTFPSVIKPAGRVKDAAEIRAKFPSKIPVIIERFEGDKYLPMLDRCKFLVPDHITVAELMQIVRRKLQLHPEQAFFLLVNEKSMVSNSMTLLQLYQMEADQDGFLYIVYTSMPAFGRYFSVS